MSSTRSDELNSTRKIGSGPEHRRTTGYSQPGHALAMALRKAYLTMHRGTDNALSGCGITADQFVVLAALNDSEASAQKELVQRTSSDPSTIRAMLVLLEKKGLVKRQAHPTDRRARTVRLTDAGRRTFAEAWSLTETLRQRMSGALNADDTPALVNSLNLVTEAMTDDSTSPDAQLGVKKGRARR